jgi:hypothetical protein
MWTWILARLPVVGRLVRLHRRAIRAEEKAERSAKRADAVIKAYGDLRGTPRR